MRRSRFVAACGALLLVTGCTNAANEPSPETRTAGQTPASSAPPSSPNPSSPDSSSPSPSTVQSRGDPRAREVVSDLEAPWGLVTLKDGSFLISERDARKIVRVDNGSTSPVRTIDEADPAGEGGLLGLAITEDEKTVFAYYTAAERQSNRLDELERPRPRRAEGHSPGHSQGFHPQRRPDGDRSGRLSVRRHRRKRKWTLAQDKDSLGGKILRLRLDGRPAPGNPFDNEVFSYGHRNVQGLAFDDDGRLWASEFGQQDLGRAELDQRGGQLRMA